MQARIFLYIIIFISIFLMSIGYAALNINLTISGEAIVTGLEKIKITNVSVLSQTSNAYETYTSEYTDETTNIHVSLPNIDSTITLEIEITNETHSYYKIESIIENFYSNPIIKYEIIDEKRLHFNPVSVNTFQIKFYYDGIKGTDSKITLNLEYIFKPVDYEVLDYITSTGTQYIDSGIMNTGDYLFESEFLVKAYTAGSGTWIFSGRVDPNYSLGVFLSHAGGAINAYGAPNVYYEPKVSLNKWLELRYSREENILGGVTYPVEGGNLIPEEYATTILIGGNTVNWDLTVDTRHFNGHMKYFKITDVISDTILRDFIPVRLINSNEIGFYDLVENKFYANIGTGVYTAP